MHAGIITAEEGGEVTVVKRDGQDSYEGATSNDVNSTSYGSYRASFAFSEANINCETTSDSLTKNISSVLCPTGCRNRGSIWGTDVYTSDSSLCRAAIHAGIILSELGGLIKVYKQKGIGSYDASTRNGITSSQYGSWPRAFTFKKEYITVISCTKRADSISENVVTVKCPSGCEHTGRLWGTDIYTADSYICLAAMHAGIITAESGGLIKVYKRNGIVSYDESTRNGITSSQYGAWPRAFTFKKEYTIVITCTKRADSISEDVVTLKCPSGCKHTGRLWGTDIYSADSYICLAAMHAGIITAESGGTIKVYKQPGIRSYTSSIRNGITSKQYGSWPSSFTFKIAE